MKKILAPLLLAFSLVAMTTGCSSPDPVAQPQQASEVEEYIGVCIDPETQNRVDDDYCEEGDDDFNPYFVPYFYPYGYIIPALGFPVYGGYSTINGVYTTGFDKKGGNSSSYRSNGTRFVPKGYTLPSNAKYKTFKPTTPQAPAPKNMSKTPAPHPTSVPVAPAPAKTTPAPAKTTPAPAKSQAPAPAKSQAPVKKQDAPKTQKKTSNYKAPKTRKR